jgi:hypothetical protein
MIGVAYQPMKLSLPWKHLCCFYRLRHVLGAIALLRFNLVFSLTKQQVHLLLLEATAT